MKGKKSKLSLSLVSLSLWLSVLPTTYAVAENSFTVLGVGNYTNQPDLSNNDASIFRQKMLTRNSRWCIF